MFAKKTEFVSHEAESFAHRECDVITARPIESPKTHRRPTKLGSVLLRRTQWNGLAMHLWSFSWEFAYPSSLSIPQEAEVALTNCHMLTMSQSISLMHTVLMPARVQNFTTKPHLCKTVLKVLICTGLGIHRCDAAGDYARLGGESLT